MPKPLNSETSTALAADQLLLALLLSLDWPGGESNWWTGYSDLRWGGKTFQPTGVLGKVSAINATENVQADNVIVSLSGIPADMVQFILREDYRGRRADIYMAVFNTQGLIGDPALAYRGVMDVATIRQGADSGEIAMSVESRMIDFNRPRVLRYTNALQQSLFPGDKGLEYVAQIQQKELPWGKPT